MKVIVPVDGSKYSDEAIRVAADYAKAKSVSICILNVVPFIEDIDLEISASERDKVNASFTKKGNAIIQQASGQLTAQNIISNCSSVVTARSIPDAIVEYAAKEKADLIIMGSHGAGASTRFRMGSVSSAVVSHSHCSVYIVKL